MSQIVVSDTVPNAQAFQAIVVGTIQNVAVGASSAQSAIFQPKTSIVRLYSSTDCWISIGVNPTASPTTSLFLPGGMVEYFGFAEGENSQLAVIQSSASGSLNITEGA